MSTVQPTVLLVEDDPLNLMLIEQWTEMAGFASISAHSGQEALMHWAKTPNVVMVTDLNLTDMRGDFLIAQMRTQERTSERRRTPILLMTGMAPDDLASDLKQQCVEVLYKPVSYEHFLSALSQCCKGLAEGK